MTDTRYARNGNVHLAYQIHGTGPIDLVFMPGTFVVMESYDEHPLLARFFRRLQSFARVIILDRRGLGQSDPLGPEGAPSPEAWAEDLAAVIEHARAQRPSILAGFDAGLPAMALAAARPAAIASLVLVNAYARFLNTGDHEPGLDPSTQERYESAIEQGTEGFDVLAVLAPTVAGDERFRSWWDRSGRRGASPATAQTLIRSNLDIDMRGCLARISVPTLVLHKTHDAMCSIEQGRYLADHIPDAKLIEIPGPDHLIWVEADGILDAAEEFFTGVRAAPVDRVLATVLFTDIVDSTRQATELGDRRWRDLLDQHDNIVRRVIERQSGRVIKSTGDGTLATFAGPGPAIRCAVFLREELAAIGIRVRVGIHTGEIEVRGDDVGGIAVHIAARVMGEAGPDEIIVSSVVPPLVVGSEIAFTDRGPRELKGVPGEWRVLAVDG